MLFFTALAVIIAHSVIPHHHHEKEVTIGHHENAQHEEDNANDLGILFSHFQHIGVNNQFVSTHQSPSIKKIANPLSDITLKASCNIYFLETGEPVPLFFPEPPDILSSSGIAAFSLRGPPSFTV